VSFGVEPVLRRKSRVVFDDCVIVNDHARLLYGIAAATFVNIRETTLAIARNHSFFKL
jgi:hypothetical protein